MLENKIASIKLFWLFKLNFNLQVGGTETLHFGVVILKCSMKEQKQFLEIKEYFYTNKTNKLSIVIHITIWKQMTYFIL